MATTTTWRPTSSRGGEPPARRREATVGQQQQHGQRQRHHHGRGPVGAPHRPGRAGPVPGLDPRGAEPRGREARPDAEHQPAERVAGAARRDQRPGHGPEDRQHDELAGHRFAGRPGRDHRDRDHREPEAAGQHRPGPGRDLTQGARAVHRVSMRSAGRSVAGFPDQVPDRHPEHVHAEPAEGDGQQQVRLQRTDGRQHEVPDEEAGEQEERHPREPPGAPAGQRQQQQPEERPEQVGHQRGQGDPEVVEVGLVQLDRRVHADRVRGDRPGAVPERRRRCGSPTCPRATSPSATAVSRGAAHRVRWARPSRPSGRKNMLATSAACSAWCGPGCSAPQRIWSLKSPWSPVSRWVRYWLPPLSKPARTRLRPAPTCAARDSGGGSDAAGNAGRDERDEVGHGGLRDVGGGRW